MAKTQPNILIKLKSKKLLFIILFTVLGLAVILIVSRFFIRSTKVVKIAKAKKEPTLKKEQNVSLEELEEPSTTFLKPKEILEREEKIVGEKIEIPTTETKSQSKDFSTKRKSYLKSQDTSTLIVILKEALKNNEEGLICQVLKILEQRGQDVVSILREEILNNFSNPQVRRNAVLGLFYADKKKAIPILKTVLKVDPDETVRLVALFALDGLSPADPIFEEISKIDPSEKVRLKAREYIRSRSKDQ